MEFFGSSHLGDFSLSSCYPVRDVVVGTPPDSLLTLVSQDLPEDIFEDQVRKNFRLLTYLHSDQTIVHFVRKMPDKHSPNLAKNAG